MPLTISFCVKRDRISNFVDQHKPNEPTVEDSLAYVPSLDRISYGINGGNMYEPSSSYGPPNFQIIQPRPLAETDMSLLSEIAASAVEELKRLFLAEEQFWVKSCIDETYVIDTESYERFSHAVKHFSSTTAHVESSKAVTVVHVEAINLIQMFLDPVFICLSILRKKYSFVFTFEVWIKNVKMVLVSCRKNGKSFFQRL